MGRTSGAATGVVGSIATPLPTNTSAQNKAIIDAALAGLQPGATCTINVAAGQSLSLGGHVRPPGVRVTMSGGSGRPGLQNAGLKADPAMVASYFMAGAAWANATANPDDGGEFDHLTIDMNGVAAYGLAECGRDFKIHDNKVYNWSGAFTGIAMGGTIGTTGTMNNGSCINNVSKQTAPVSTAGQHCILVNNLGTTPLSDTDIMFNDVNGGGDDLILCQTGGNINTIHNHGSTLVRDGSAFIHYTTMGGSSIVENIMDDTSRPNAGGQTNSCILVDTVVNTPAVRQSVIAGNRVHADESHGAGAADWTYISVTGNTAAHSYVRVGPNEITQDVAGTGTSFAYAFNANAGVTMVVDLDPGQIFGTNPVPTVGGAGTVQQSGAIPSSFWNLPANPAATTNVAATAMGLAIPFTPKRTGNIEIIAYMDGQTATGAAVLTASLHYGTGAAPVNGAQAALGTQAPAGAYTLKASAAATAIPLALPSGYIAGLALGTPIWVDICIQTSVGADAASITNIAVNIKEIL